MNAIAQPPGVGADFVEERSRRRGGCVRRAGVVPGGRVERRSAVAYRAREHVLCRHALPGLREEGAGGVASAARLEAEHAAARGRDPDRAAAVAPVCDRDDARGHGRARTATRAAGGAGQVPGVVGRPEEFGFGHWDEPEFGGIGLADGHEACGLVPHDDLAVAVGQEVAEETAAAAGGDACVGGDEVLQQEGNALERAVRHAACGRRAPDVVHLLNDRVDLRVQALSSGDGFLREFGGRDLAPAHEVGEAEAVVRVVFGERHPARSFLRRGGHGAGREGVC